MSTQEHISLEEQLKFIDEIANMAKSFLEFVDAKDSMSDFGFVCHADVFINCMAQHTLKYANKKLGKNMQFIEVKNPTTDEE